MHKITFDLWGFVNQVVKIRVFRLIRSEQEQALPVTTAVTCIMLVSDRCVESLEAGVAPLCPEQGLGNASVSALTRARCN